MKLVILLAVITTGCGQGIFGGKDSGSDSSTTEESTSESGKLQSLALDSKDDLPECTEANDKQLAYVTDEEQFYVCGDAEWTEITIGEELASNEWKDAATGYIWMIGGVTSYGLIGQACDGDYDAATADEVKAAGKHGLESDDGIWINGATNQYLDGATARTETGSTKHRAVCVKK